MRETSLVNRSKYNGNFFLAFNIHYKQLFRVLAETH